MKFTKLTLAASLVLALSACSSSSTDYSLDKSAANNPHATTPAKPEEPAKPAEPAESAKPKVVNSLENRNLSFPNEKDIQKSINAEAPLITNGRAFYFSGGSTREFLNPKTKEKMNLVNVFKDHDFMQKANIDAEKVQYLEVKADDGTLLGKFQFVNQSYSSFATFVPELTQNYFNTDTRKEEPTKYENLAIILSNPTTQEQFAKQQGSATYSGHTLGYVDGPNGETPKQGYMGDINLNVNFETKMIDGKVSNRQDGLTKYNYHFTDDDDKPTPESIALTKQDLILKPTPITKNDNGAIGFKGHENVVVINNGKEVTITGYSGSFAGPNADEVVGKIGNGNERIAFGASRDK